MTEPERRIVVRYTLALGLALAPLIAAAVLSGPSLGLFAAFSSGVFFSMVMFAWGERAGRMSREQRR